MAQNSALYLPKPKVHETHGSNKHANIYMAAAEIAKIQIRDQKAQRKNQSKRITGIIEKIEKIRRTK